jgi:hypothetical protein
MTNESEIAELLRRGPVPVTDAAELAELLRQCDAPADLIEAVEAGALHPIDPGAFLAAAADAIGPRSGDHG